MRVIVLGGGVVGVTTAYVSSPNAIAKSRRKRASATPA